MAGAVLDACALLAWLEDEPGAQPVHDVLASGAAIMSAVNWSDVLARLVDRTWSRIEAGVEVRILR